MDICVYHNQDLDGHCSGAIIRYFLKNKIMMVGANYGDTPLDIFYSKDIKNIYIVDFSYPKLVMDQLSNKIIWIDHHKSAIKDLENIEFKIKITDEELSACELTWLFFNNLISEGVSLLGKWDSHRIDEDWHNACRFQLGMGMYETNPIKDGSMVIWNQIFKEEGEENLFVKKTIEAGVFIENYLINLNNNLSENIFRIKFKGYNCVVYNGPKAARLLESHLSEEWPLGLYYQNVGDKVVVGLRSDWIDVSEIAKEFGGGGHKGAAGFTTNCSKLLNEFN